jgi:DNA-binding CsgD family transcriptional regulator
MTASLLERRTRTQALEHSMPALSSLTLSERRILSMVAAGKSTKDIAAELHIHYRTVETHRATRVWPSD